MSKRDRASDDVYSRDDDNKTFHYPALLSRHVLIDRVPQRRRVDVGGDVDDVGSDENDGGLYNHSQRRRVEDAVKGGNGRSVGYGFGMGMGMGMGAGITAAAAASRHEMSHSRTEADLPHKPAKLHGDKGPVPRSLTAYQELERQRKVSESGLAAMNRAKTTEVEQIQQKLGFTSPDDIARILAGMHVSGSPYGGRQNRRTRRRVYVE